MLMGATYAFLAKRLTRLPSKQEIAGSSPAEGVSFFVFIFSSLI
jgi:hypothetical protein